MCLINCWGFCRI